MTGIFKRFSPIFGDCFFVDFLLNLFLEDYYQIPTILGSKMRRKCASCMHACLTPIGAQAI